LTVNYRTPQPIADLAYKVRRSVDEYAQPTESIRDGEPVRFVSADDAEGPLEAGIFTDERGRLNAIIDVSNVEEVKGLEFDHVTDTRRRLNVISDVRHVEEVKCLEFDHVTAVNPEEIIKRSPLGVNDLYVALTRATKTLTIVGHWPQEFH